MEKDGREPVGTKNAIWSTVRNVFERMGVALPPESGSDSRSTGQDFADSPSTLSSTLKNAPVPLDVTGLRFSYGTGLVGADRSSAPMWGPHHYLEALPIVEASVDSKTVSYTPSTFLWMPETGKCTFTPITPGRIIDPFVRSKAPSKSIASNSSVSSRGELVTKETYDRFIEKNVTGLIDHYIAQTCVNLRIHLNDISILIEVLEVDNGFRIEIKSRYWATPAGYCDAVRSILAHGWPNRDTFHQIKEAVALTMQDSVKGEHNVKYISARSRTR